MLGDSCNDNYHNITTANMAVCQVAKCLQIHRWHLPSWRKHHRVLAFETNLEQALCQSIRISFPISTIKGWYYPYTQWIVVEGAELWVFTHNMGGSLLFSVEDSSFAFPLIHPNSLACYQAGKSMRHPHHFRCGVLRRNMEECPKD